MEAACEIELVCVVDCDWILLIALMISTGPQAQPTRQPVMAQALDTPLSVRVRSNSFGSTCAMVVNSKPS